MAYTFGYRLDGPTLAGAIGSLENDADFQALVHNPLLQLDKLHVQALEFLLILPAAKLFRFTGTFLFYLSFLSCLESLCDMALSTYK